MFNSRWVSGWIIAAGVLLLSGLGCSGGKGGEGKNPGRAAVVVSPSKASLAVGTSAQLSASGGNFGTLTWVIQESGGGTITPDSGGTTVIYQAPATPGVFHLKVSSINPPAEDTATLEVLSAGDAANIGIRVVPSKFTMQARAVTRVGSRGRGKKDVIPPPPVFTASDEVDLNAIYTIQESPAGGRVDALGNYTAPAQAGVYHLVAYRPDDLKVAGFAEVTVTPAGASVEKGQASAAVGSITPLPAIALLEPQDHSFLSALASGLGSPLVNWSLLEGTAAGNLVSAGSADPNQVIYTAPAGSGIYHAVATSQSDLNTMAQAVLQVGVPVGVLSSPPTAIVAAHAIVRFSASVTNASVPDLTWSITEGPVGGSLTPFGNIANYTAPPSPGLFHVVATSVADPSKSATSLVQVTGSSAVAVSVVPSSTRVAPGTSLLIQSTVTGAANRAVSWTANGGATVTTDGLVTVPLQIGPVTATATSAADASKSASATLTVANLPLFTSVPPAQAVPITLYTYAITTTHPDSLAITLALETAPTGAVLSGSTINWTPLPAQAGSQTFRLRATDSAGGVAFQSWTVQVSLSGNAILSGPYFWMLYRRQPGPRGNTPATGQPLPSLGFSSEFGLATFKGDGNLNFLGSTNTNGLIQTFFYQSTYSVQPDRSMSGRGTFAGGVLASGDVLALASMTPGDNPGLIIAIRKSGAFSTASTVGNYFNVGFKFKNLTTQPNTPATGQPLPAPLGFVGDLVNFNSDGAGNLSITGQQNRDGVITTKSPETDLYSVAADGTLTVSNGGDTFSGGLLNGGTMCILGGASSGTTPSVNIALKKGGTFSNASLAGTYFMVNYHYDLLTGQPNTPAMGQPIPEPKGFRSGNGTITFDGVGGLVAAGQYNTDGVISSGSSSGTYSVAPDGSYTGAGGAYIGSVLAGGNVVVFAAGSGFGQLGFWICLRK